MPGTELNDGGYRAPLSCSQEMGKPRPREVREVAQSHATTGLVKRLEFQSSAICHNVKELVAKELM